MTSREATEAGGGPPVRQARLREVFWGIGQQFPPGFAGEHIILAAVRPRLGYVHWHLRPAAVDRVHDAVGGAFRGAVLTLRVYDVTGIAFDGSNAHEVFDVPVGTLSGHQYLELRRSECALMTEVGYRLADGAFHALARSNAVYFDRDRPIGHDPLGSLSAGRGFGRPSLAASRAKAVEAGGPDVEPVQDERVRPPPAAAGNGPDQGTTPGFQRSGAEPAASLNIRPLSIAVVHNELDPAAAFGGRLRPAIDRLVEQCAGPGLTVERFGVDAAEDALGKALALPQRVESRCRLLVERIAARHREAPFDLLHCHDWTAAPAGLDAARRLSLPLVLSLHSLEHERTRADGSTDVSDAAIHWEKAGAAAASLIVVPRTSTRGWLLTLYRVAADKVLVIPDLLEDLPTGPSDSSAWKRQRGLDPDAPVVLFAGELSEAAGADLLIEAAAAVAADDRAVQFALVGDGPLKGALEARVGEAGLGQRCRFFGDLPPAALEPILMACDVVVIPARTRQDDELAQRAVGAGKPVLCTRQAQISCVVHGQNGLLADDLPGPIARSMHALLADPLGFAMLRTLTRPEPSPARSPEYSATDYVKAYQKALAHAATV